MANNVDGWWCEWLRANELTMLLTVFVLHCVNFICRAITRHNILMMLMIMRILMLLLIPMILSIQVTLLIISDTNDFSKESCLSLTLCEFHLSCHHPPLMILLIPIILSIQQTLLQMIFSRKLFVAYIVWISFVVPSPAATSLLETVLRCPFWVPRWSSNQILQ